MRTNQTIRAMLSAFVLLVFLVGISPRQHWHDLLADHRDVMGTAHHSDELQLNNTGFNCGWNNQAANTSPFVEAETIQMPVSSLVFPSYTLAPLSPLHLSPLTQQLLRGPPAIV